MAKREPGTLIPLGLLVTAILQLVLGVVQWMELLLAQVTGDSFCSISSTLNCTAVWSSPVAKALQSATHVPVAGWGVVWSLGALVAALGVVRQGMAGQSADRFSVVAKIFGAAGALASLAFLGLSASIGAFCLTCLTTYALSFLFAFFALRLPLDRPLKQQALVPALAGAAGLVVIGYLVVLYPGLRTPTGDETGAELAAAAAKAAPAEHAHSNQTQPPAAPNASQPAEPTSRLGRFLSELSPQAQQALANVLAEMKAAPVPDVSAFKRRILHHGDASAPVQMLDFSDIQCPHCAQLAVTGDELRRLSPEGAFAQESRWFPLDAECNPKLDPRHTDGSGVRCAGARVMICLEGDPGYDKARHALFKAQQELSSPDMVLGIASDASGRSKADLSECMGRPETEAKLRADIEYAFAYDLEGTPLVVMNGRKVQPIGPLLYALILAEGRLDHPDFAALPPPRG
ncbi:MAG: thioredoxin domain-containing protein [Deltaproteobacteria bacterium]|nr:thioredoxin domain-containing protein [Deltaproteobacteria bacterium]